MSNNNINKITIEKRVFKLENNKEFVLEYPSNYNEIVDRRLKKLNDEYDEVVSKNDKVKNDDDNKENINLDNKNNNENINNNNVNNKEYYQPLGEAPDNMNDDDEFIEVKEEINDEIKEQKIEINNNNNNENEVNINDFEFIDDKNNNDKVEYEPKEIIDDLKKFNNENKKDDNKNNNNIKKSRSPLKNPEKIKESMRKLNIKTPEWAKNLTDEDFMNRVKFYLNKKNKK